MLHLQTVGVLSHCVKQLQSQGQDHMSITDDAGWQELWDGNTHKVARVSGYVLYISSYKSGIAAGSNMQVHACQQLCMVCAEAPTNFGQILGHHSCSKEVCDVNQHQGRIGSLQVLQPNSRTSRTAFLKNSLQKDNQPVGPWPQHRGLYSNTRPEANRTAPVL